MATIWWKSLIVFFYCFDSASKTISSVFHLHNTSTIHELLVYLDGQCLWHESHASCLGVTLDRTLSYREHLTKTAGKLKNWNNLLMKLAGSTWGASTNTLWSSALALCYSAAEYCTPDWSRCAHRSQVDMQLNSTMHLISGTLRSTPLPWLYLNTYSTMNIEHTELLGR